MSNVKVNALAPLVLTAVAGITAFVLVLFLHFDRSVDLATLDKSGMRSEIVWGISYIALLPALVWLGLTAYGIVRAYCAPRFLQGVTVVSGVTAIAATIGAQFIKGPGDALVRSLGTRGFRGIVIFTAVAFFLAVLVITLVMSACVTLANSDSVEVTSLRRRVRDGRILLYSSAAALVIGVLQMWALQGWAARQLFRLNTDPVEYLALARSMGLGSGALYTLLMLLFFVPVAVAHQDSVENAFDAADAGEKMDRAKWLAANGLNISMASAAVDILAIASPIVTALGLAGRLGV
jgi:hypothetical protein